MKGPAERDYSETQGGADMQALVWVWQVKCAARELKNVLLGWDHATP